MHYRVPKTEFWSKLSSEYNSYETLKQQIPQDSL